MNEVEVQLVKSGQLRLACQGCENDAEQHCDICKTLLCTSCSDDHNRYKPFTKHKLTPVVEMTVPPKASLMCGKHKKNELRLFCSSCQVLVCDDCTIKYHKNHDYDVLEQTADDQRAALREQADQLELQAITPLREGIENIKQELESLSSSRDVAEKNIQESFDALTSAISRRAKEHRQQIKEVFERKQK
eukprot:151051-Rhodomonas_salina.1